MSEIGAAQQRALNDTEVAWVEAIAALDQAQAHAENLNEATPQLLADDLFWEARAAIDRMRGMLNDLIAEVIA